MTENFSELDFVGGWFRRHGAFMQATDTWLIEDDTCGIDASKMYKLAATTKPVWRSKNDISIVCGSRGRAPGPKALPLPPLHRANEDASFDLAARLPDESAPIVITVTASRAPLRDMVPIHADFHDELGRHFALPVGFVSKPESHNYGVVPHAQVNWMLPSGALGTMAVGVMRVGLDLFLSTLNDLSKSSVLVRVDVAGLGLSRSDLRRLERYASNALSHYSEASGAPALMLSELGLVREYMDCSMVLKPGAAARVDLRLPERRPAPSFVEIIQEGPLRSHAPLKIALCGRDGDELCVETDATPEERRLRRFSGAVSAAIFPDEGGSLSSALRLSHTIAVAPTARVPHISLGRAEPGEWDITVTNAGTVPARLTFALEDSMPLAREWQIPQPTIAVSRSRNWDAEMLHFVRPRFFDLKSRFDALVNRADRVPPSVLRRYVEPSQWPFASVSHGTRLMSMPMDVRALIRAPRSGARRVQGADLSVIPTGRVDRLLGHCMEALLYSPAAEVDQYLDVILGDAAHS